MVRPSVVHSPGSKAGARDHRESLLLEVALEKCPEDLYGGRAAARRLRLPYSGGHDGPSRLGLGMREPVGSHRLHDCLDISQKEDTENVHEVR